MHEWLPILAAVGISVPVAARMEISSVGCGMLFGGLWALIQYFGA